MRRSSKRTSRASRRTSRPLTRSLLRRNTATPLALPPEPLLIERIDDVSDHLSMPGQYYTTTGQQAYTVAKALTWHPLVQAGQDTYFAEGSAFHWTVLPEEKPLGSSALPTELLNERVEAEFYATHLAESETLRRNPARASLRANDYDGGEDWGITETYYTDRLDAYDRWQAAFWRELLQNSRDAGATRIDLSSEEVTYTDPKTGDSRPAVLCVCRDNGSGMDRDTLKRAFFTLGGSVKPAGAVGGFGDAKELILVPWLQYEVKTRDLLAVGQHQKLFPPGIASGQEYLSGTQIKVWMPASKATSAMYALSVLEKSYLKGITVTVNGERVKADLTGGTKVREYPVTMTTYVVMWSDQGQPRETRFSYSDDFYEFKAGLNRQGIAYTDGKSVSEVGTMEIWRQKPADKLGRGAKREGCFVRGSGVFMFEKQIDSNIRGAIYIDINAPPRGVFTRKRDSLATSSSAWQHLESYLSELATDPLSALKQQRAERDKLKIIYTGSGPLDVQSGVGAEAAEQQIRNRREKAAFVGAEMATKADLSQVKETKKGEVEVTDEQFEQMFDYLKTVLEAEERDAEEREKSSTSLQGPPELIPLPEGFESIVKDARFTSREQIAGALQFAAWKPDLMVYQNLDNFTMPKDFSPMTMKPKYQRLLRLWAELCKYALVRLRMFEPFGVGWIFDTEADEITHEQMVIGAGHLVEGGLSWLLLNPAKIKRITSASSEYPEYEIEGDYYDLSSDRSIEELCASVIHEVTHAQGFKKHDQRYSYALTDNIKVAFGMERAAKKILKGVNRVVREQAVQRKAAIESEAAMPWKAVVGKLIATMSVAARNSCWYYDDWEHLAKGKLNVAEAVRKLSASGCAKNLNDPEYVSSWADYLTLSEEVPSRVLLRLYKGLNEKGLIASISNTNAEKVFDNASGWRVKEALLIDPREDKEALAVPAQIGVYNVTKRSKSGRNEWVIREGYSGLRGKEVASGVLYSWEDLSDYSRYVNALEQAGAQRMWVVWVPTVANRYKGFFSPAFREIPGNRFEYEREVVSGDRGQTWYTSVGYTGSHMTTAAAAQAAVAEWAANKIALAQPPAETISTAVATPAEPAAMSAERTELLVPESMDSAQFVELFPLYLIRAYAVPAETLRNAVELRDAARSVARASKGNLSEFLMDEVNRPRADPRMKVVFSEITMRGTLDYLGREAIRAYFDAGGAEFDDGDFYRMARVVVSGWDLTNTPLAVSLFDSLDKLSVSTT